MSSDVPLLFDRALGRERLRRAKASGYAGFLLDRCTEELGERLSAVQRSFALALDLGSPGPEPAHATLASGKAGRVLRLAPVPGPADDAGPAVIGDEEALPFGPASFDLAFSCLSLQGVNDLPGVLAQLRRVLKPDGLFLGCLLGGETLSELRAAFAAAETECEGGISPRVAPFADVRALGALLQRAGFALPVTDLDRVTVRYPHVFALMADLRAMGWTSNLAERRRTPLWRATLLRMAEIYAGRFADPDGRIRATFEIVWLSGWAPHESQQKPLKPGSATRRLAEALGTTERPLSG